MLPLARGRQQRRAQQRVHQAGQRGQQGGLREVQVGLGGRGEGGGQVLATGCCGSEQAEPWPVLRRGTCVKFRFGLRGTLVVVVP